MGFLTDAMTFGGVLGSGTEAKANAFRRFRASQRQGISDSIAGAEEAGAGVANSPLAKEGKNFLFETFRSDMPPGFEHQGAQLAQQLRIAQESRGLRKSTTSAVAEATSLAAFNSQMAFQQQQFKASLLPDIERFATLAERTRNQRVQIDAPLLTAWNTGSPLVGPNAPLQDPLGLSPSAARDQELLAFTMAMGNMFLGGGGGMGGMGGMGGGGGMGGMGKMGGSAQPQSGLFSIPKGQQGFSAGGMFAQT